MTNLREQVPELLFRKRDSGPKEINEFKIPRRLLRGALVWPQDDSLLIRLFGALYQIPGIYILILMCVSIITEEKTDGAVEYMKCFGDIMGFVTNSMKHFFMYRGKGQVEALRRLVSEDFPAFEEKVHYKIFRNKRPLWPWIPSIVYALVTAASFIVCLITLTSSRDERAFPISVPKKVLTNDFLFYLTMSLFIPLHTEYWFAYSAVDGLYITFTAIIEDKTQTLREALKDLNSLKGAAQEEAMINIIKYHQLIIKLRDGTEALLRNPAIGQVIFILSSLGAQIIRLVYIGLPLSQAAFVGFYTGWVLGQLNTYCMRGESATQAGLRVSFSAYEVYKTGMTSSVSQTLTILLCRAQRPLKFTAYGLITFNRKTFLDILKRCYSLFSTLTNLRGD